MLRAAATQIFIMKTQTIKLVSGVVAAILLSSCASIFTKSSKELTFKGVPGTTVIDVGKNKTIAEVGQNGFATVKLKKQLSKKHIKATNVGYQPQTFTLDTKIEGAFWANLLFWPGMAVDAATGKMKTWKDDLIDVTLIPISQVTVEETTEVVAPQLEQRVTRQSPGTTDMEKTIIRWFFDSDPRGARIYYRVISSVPDEVKNTNEIYLSTTPLEETRAFNIIGLTYDNSRDVTIEIKVSKRGYEEQIKRFNVRQALDQQEINSFFELVPKTN